FYLTCPIFVSVLPPRPLSTLFPYTTLFRSDRAAQFQVLTTATGAKIPWDGKSPLVASPNGAAVKQLSEGFAEFRRVFPPFISFSDRKSTRLNSSHQIISYAVFCLKKKKKTN